MSLKFIRYISIVWLYMDIYENYYDFNLYDFEIEIF